MEKNLKKHFYLQIRVTLFGLLTALYFLSKTFIW